MNAHKTIFTLVLCLFLTSLQAQKYDQCVHCKMDVKDDFHKATATDINGIVHFDAIECLINYLKDKDENTFIELKVADYQSGELTNAKTASYLKSQAIPSPMGAFLSAFSSKETALEFQAEKEGDLYNWSEIKTKFRDSRFGFTEHLHHNHNKADAYAPAGIMGDHLHPKGGLMFAVKQMYMDMTGNLDGNDPVSDSDIFSQYMVAQQSMSMEMYMISVMYAPSDVITLMLMQNFVNKDMELKAMMMMDGMTMFNDFVTSSNGLSDMKMSALLGLYASNRNSVHLNTMINIPLGSIDNRNDTPMMLNAKLPYSMQLGSGTFDVTLGATYKGNSGFWTWGVQQLNTLRTGKNKERYRLGNVFQVNSWLSYSLSNNFSTSLRISADTLGKIKGTDPDLNPMMVSTADTDNYGGEKIRSALGLNFLIPNSRFLISLEAGIPIYQNYNGIFMDEQFSINSAIKYTIL